MFSHGEIRKIHKLCGYSLLSVLCKDALNVNKSEPIYFAADLLSKNQFTKSSKSQVIEH